MSLSAKFQALTQREKVLFSVLGLAILITGCVYVYPLLFAEKTMGSKVAAPPPVPAKQIGPAATEISTKRDLPIADVKNPFQVPAQYQVRKETTSAPAVHTASGPAIKPVSVVPVLSGIIAGGSVKMAILELGGDSDTVGVGGTFGGYTVASITETQVVLSGPEGRQVLNIGR